MSLPQIRTSEGFLRGFPAWLLALRLGRVLCALPLRAAGLQRMFCFWGFLTIEVHGKMSLCLKDHTSGFLVSVDLLSQFG